MEQLKHECGVALIRLRKPLNYYQEKYGTASYGLNKLYLMMEKQHNRGQEGAGLACVNLDTEPGNEYMFRERAEGASAITKIFNSNQMPFLGQLYMGHLRYSTTGKRGLQYVHPFLRRNNWRAKNLCICGNFNMTNIEEIFQHLTSQGQCPRIYSDAYITLELMGHRLDREVERNYEEARVLGLEGTAITDYIDQHVDMSRVLSTSLPQFDGGYVMCGLTGSGEMFAMRDPWGIRPAFYYQDDEIVTLASERPVLQTTFDLQAADIQELTPGSALIVNRSGELSIKAIQQPRGNHACSFERIYFSRGSDADIYLERKQLGAQLVDSVTRAIDGDINNTVFSYIPNTAEVAYYGLVEGFNQRYDTHVRSEKVVWKDIKMRTFITEDASRKDLASHVYDVTYGIVQQGQDNLVVIDDSIVRGTTLNESILRILARLNPKKIVIVSSAPQIRYPDYYGIDMARMEEFCAFRAAVSLLRKRGLQHVLDDTYQACKAELLKPVSDMRNCVLAVYDSFDDETISQEIANMLKPANIDIPVQLVFQSIDGLHQAIPNHPGDWYFTGSYPTPGGTRLCLKAYVEWYEQEQATADVGKER